MSWHLVTRIFSVDGKRAQLPAFCVSSGSFLVSEVRIPNSLDKEAYSLHHRASTPVPSMSKPLTASSSDSGKEQDTELFGLRLITGKIGD